MTVSTAKKTIIKRILICMIILTAMFGLTGCPDSIFGGATGAKVTWAGMRVSPYGFRRDGSGSTNSFPTVNEFDGYASKISSYYEGSTGTFVWIVGTVSSSDDYSCSLNFPKPTSGVPSGVSFSDEDRNEDFLKMADEKGYSVWLQVESGFVDIVKLAKLVMKKYKDHPCVKGFGIDVEWYKNTTDGEPGTPLDDATAQAVDEAVKSINPEYTVFVKHFEASYMPPSYRSDMIFVNDSQGFGSLYEMENEFSRWASKFSPNPIFLQIGYKADEEIWSEFSNPVAELGTALAASCPANTKLGIIWVDFTLRRALK